MLGELGGCQGGGVGVSTRGFLSSLVIGLTHILTRGRGVALFDFCATFDITSNPICIPTPFSYIPEIILAPYEMSLSTPLLQGERVNNPIVI